MSTHLCVGHPCQICPPERPPVPVVREHKYVAIDDGAELRLVDGPSGCDCRDCRVFRATAAVSL